MKKIVKQIDAMVLDMGAGMVMAYPGKVTFDKQYRYFARASRSPGKVVLVSGGGSGHEPTHGGFVGAGMLDAAVCGEIFSSPSQIQIYHCLKTVTGDQGALLVIKNYSGDVMNFQNAAALAGLDGLKVDYVKVADDIAVEDSLYTVGRRGVAGTIFIHKIAGAAAEQGKDLAEVKRLGQKTADNVRSVGFAYTSCTVPAKGTPTFALGDNEMEYGVGIHGEPGVRREEIIAADKMAERMVGSILADLGVSRGDTVALLVNGFGATPLLELFILNRYAMKELETRGLRVSRALVGNYMTSIDMAGASLSVLKLDDELQRYLAAPCDTPALKFDGTEQAPEYVDFAAAESAGETTPNYLADAAGGGNVIAADKLTFANLVYIVDKMAEIIIRNETAFCDLDSYAGDGDFGKSIANGFRQLKRCWNSILRDHGASIGDFLDACSLVIMEYCGGASGPIWGFAFKYAAKSAAGKPSLSVSDMAELLAAAVQGIQDVGRRAFGRGAGIGDKTLMDALLPCAAAWQANNKQAMLEMFKVGAEAAVQGAESTKKSSLVWDGPARLGNAVLAIPMPALTLSALFSRNWLLR